MAACEHEAPRTKRVCVHLFDDGHAGYLEAFTGRGVDSEMLCNACAAANDRTHVVEACAACLAAVTGSHEWTGLVGAPQIVVAAQGLSLVQEEIEVLPVQLMDLAPVCGDDRNLWLGISHDRRLYGFDLDARTRWRVAQLPEGALDLAQPVTLYVSANGKYAAVVQQKGSKGVVLDVATGGVTMTLARDDYHADVCRFPFAFVERDGRTLVVHAPGWNRLDISDAKTGELVTVRESPKYARGEPSPPHYLDYFHCGLAVSPGQQRIADGGWVWAPSGILTTWSLERWLAENVWESEDGPSRRSLGYRDYEWDAPMCWLDDRRLIVWGYGQDNDWMIPAAAIFDTVTGVAERWFAGPNHGEFVLDRELIVLDHEGFAIWDVARGARLLEATMPAPRYHPSAKCFVTLPADGRVTVARARGHHARASWNTPRVRALVTALESDRDFSGLPVLGDALEAAGCDEAALLAHCRAPGPHGRNCWALAHLHAE